MRPPPWLGRAVRAGFLVLAVALLLAYLWGEREGAAEAVRAIGAGHALALLAVASSAPRIPVYDDYLRRCGGDPDAALHPK